jgi:hypothetical protein
MGMAEDGKFGSGYEAIFGKGGKKPAAKPAAAPKAAAKKPVGKKKPAAKQK